jgi:NAD(P)H-flavin reductase
MAIASGNLNGKLEFSIRAWGKLTNELFKKQPGEEVTIDGPYGTYFPVDQIDENTLVYLIAGGTGITPIRSLIKSITKGKKIVYYGAKKPAELLYREEFEEWDADVNLIVDQGDASWGGQVGLVTELLTKLKPYGYFFVCGPNPMEQVVVDLLRENGISDNRIYVSLEKFDEHGNVVGPVLPVSDEKVPY